MIHSSIFVRSVVKWDLRRKEGRDLMRADRKRSVCAGIIILAFLSYFIIQLSIRAKEIEEKRNIPWLQTTIEFADEYIQRKYWQDWQHFGSDLEYPDWRSSYHYLELSSDVGMLLVYPPWWDEEYNIEAVMEKDGNRVRITAYYGENLSIEVSGQYQEIYKDYDIEYKNGSYIPNLQMEQETGFTTDEIVEQADKMRNAFEEEMEKMHEYQIGRAKERRIELANFVLIIFLFFYLVYSIINWIINKRGGTENEYREDTLKEYVAKKEITEKKVNKFLRLRYLLLVCGISLCIHIADPVILGFRFSSLVIFIIVYVLETLWKSFAAFYLVFYPGYFIAKRADIKKEKEMDNKPREAVLKDALTKKENRLLGSGYLLLGCGISFWTYILVPIISEFILFPIIGKGNEYVAYGISAVIAAVAFGVLWKGFADGKADGGNAGMQMRKGALWFIFGCVVTLILIQLGIILVPRFYFPEWRFYKINLLADGIAFFIFGIIVKVTEEGGVSNGV